MTLGYSRRHLSATDILAMLTVYIKYLHMIQEHICILEKILNPDPGARPTAGEILRSKWLDPVEKQ
jgi:hypothetical protein